MATFNVVILAAGKGTRMCSDKPKVLHQIAGKTMLRHVVDTALKLQPQKIVIVYGHGGELVPASLPDNPLFSFAHQEPQLGTGHAVKQAMPILAEEGMTVVLYGDVPLIQQETLELLLKDENSVTLLTKSVKKPQGYGRIIRDANANIRQIVEEKDATSEQRNVQEINTGILSAPTKLLNTWLANLSNKNAQGEYYLTDIVAMAVADNIKINSAQPAHEWEIAGVNSKQQQAELERLWQKELARKLLVKGVTLVDPDRIDIRGELSCEQDVEIDIGCIFEGSVHLGAGTKVGAYSIIKDSQIGPSSEIKPYSHLDGAEIGRGCEIGPYSRIRPRSKIADEVHIGNFVEIKNSLIADKSKANHLSYIGDSTIGKSVNVGAGTITCNYDGANKHRTTIEDNVFIGSGTQLVAPVTIGCGATIGAGSTITKDAPEATLTLSRTKQQSVPGWQRPSKKK